jgi:hypothetical protein
VAYPFPLPPPPNFRVAQVEPTHIRLTWSDYPLDLKATRRLRGFRLYRSAVKDELGQRIADETVLETGVFQYDDRTADADPARLYTLVAVEDAGSGEGPYGAGPYGGPDPGGYDLMPYNSRPFGTPLRGWSEAPFGLEPFGL